MRDKLEEIWDQMSNGDKELIFREIKEHEEFMGRLYQDKEMGFNEKYDLSEWVNWRERMMQR
jgi:hypothetical protein